MKNWLARLAAWYLQPRVMGLIYVAGPTIYDPVHEKGGWIYGYKWYIRVKREQASTVGGKNDAF